MIAELVIHRLGLCKPFHQRKNKMKDWCPLLQDAYDRRFNIQISMQDPLLTLPPDLGVSTPKQRAKTKHDTIQDSKQDKR